MARHNGACGGSCGQGENDVGANKGPESKHANAQHFRKSILAEGSFTIDNVFPGDVMLSMKIEKHNRN
jgi:hypothetical protein